MIEEDEKPKASFAVRRAGAIYFHCVRKGTITEGGCDVCKQGMSTKTYEFQRKYRKKGTICARCSRKELKRELQQEYGK